MYLDLRNYNYLCLKDVNLDNNVYIANKRYRFDTNYMREIEYFKIYYSILRLKHKINTEN